MDANLAFAFNSVLNVKGGLNMTKAVGSELNMNPELGYQASVGVQINNTLGFDLAFVQMNQSAYDSIHNFTYKESGPEIGLNATF